MDEIVFLVEVVVLLVFASGGAPGENVVTVTRNRDGDQYRVYFDGYCEERNCPSGEPFIAQSGTCKNNVSLRKRYCSGLHQHYLSTGSNLETFAVIGSDGVLEVFNEETGSYTPAHIVNQNSFSNQTEREHEATGCSISSVAVMTGNGSLVDIDSSGFSAPLDFNSRRNILIQINQSNLIYGREDYEGHFYQLSLNCTSNTGLECIVFVLNGSVNYSQESFGIPSTAEYYCNTPPSSLPQGRYSTNTSETEVTLKTNGPTVFYQNPTIQYIMIGAGCGIVILVCVITLLCIGICALSMKRKNAARIYARRMEMRYNATPGEDHYSFNQTTATTSAQNSNALGNSARAVGSPESPEENLVNGEDHTYASVDDAQAEVEEVRQKEDRAKKFAYASITFDTFKPSERPRPPSYQAEAEGEQRRSRLPSFARNYNPVANRIQLARSYEVVSLQNPKPAVEATNAGSLTQTSEHGPGEEYDILSYPDRKMTLTSQRNFSISQAEYSRDYSQLDQVKQKPQKRCVVQYQHKEPLYENSKPIPKTRTKKPYPDPHSSYTSVKKSSPPPLPPPYNPQLESVTIEENHYNVPRSHKREKQGHYDYPRSARSCENISHSAVHVGTNAAAATSIYDIPSSAPPPIAVMIEGETHELSLHSLFSQDSYVDMSASQV